MPICLHAFVRVFRPACLPAYVPACLGAYTLMYVWTMVAPWQRSMQSTDCLHLCQFHLGNWLTVIHSVPVTTTFLFAGQWRSTTGESISGNSYHSQNENMSGLNSAFSNQNRQRKCNVFVSFRLSLCHNTLCVYTDVEINTWSFPKGCPPPKVGTVFIGTVSVAWIERAGQLAADDVASVWTLWVQYPLGPRQFVGFFVGYRPFPTAREKTTRIFMYVCVHVCLHARVNVRTHASSVVLSNINGEANNI